MPIAKAGINRWAMAAFAAPMAAITGVALIALYNSLQLGAGALVGAFWQMVLVFFFVVPISLVLSWPLFRAMPYMWQRALPPFAYWSGLLVSGAAFAVVLGVWYSTQIVSWLVAAVIVGLTVNSLTFIGSRSSV